MAECKKLALTVKTGTGIKRIQEKSYGAWCNQLFELVKTRDSCQPEMAVEPSVKPCDRKRQGEDYGHDEDLSGPSTSSGSTSRGKCKETDTDTPEPDDTFLYLLKRQLGNNKKGRTC